MVTIMSDVTKRSRNRALGFTLVELLVVIAIIGILVALLLPAIQAAREAARRAQCKDNVKNIALGCLLHLDAHKFLPSGGWGKLFTGDPNRGYGENQPGSWEFNILPYIEESTIHDLGNGAATTSVAFQDAVKKRETTPVVVFSCPSRRPMRPYLAVWGAMSTEFNAFLPPLAVTGGVVKSDYAASSGASQLWSGDASDGWVTPSSYAAAATTNWKRTNECSSFSSANFGFCQNGVMYIRSEIKASQITDGTSNTYLVGEKYVFPDGYDGTNSTVSKGFTYGENQSMYSGYEWDNHRVAFWRDKASGLKISAGTEDDYQPRQDRAGYDNYAAFGSAHVGSFNMAFCDGSVQSISYDVDPYVHQFLANRMDGEVVQKSGAL